LRSRVPGPALPLELTSLTCREMRKSSAKLKGISAAAFLLLTHVQGTSATFCGDYEGATCCLDSTGNRFCASGLTCDPWNWKCVKSCGSESSKCCYNSMTQVYSCNTGLTCSKSLWKCEKPCGALGQAPCASKDPTSLQISTPACIASRP
jgi:hypothetical protein